MVIWISIPLAFFQTTHLSLGFPYHPMVICVALELTTVGAAGVSGAAEHREAKVPDKVPVPAKL